MAWTEDLERQAKEMWDAGKPASAIGVALGISRNAVIGKAFRKDWSTHAQNPKVKKAAAVPRVRPRKSANNNPLGFGRMKDKAKTPPKPKPSTFVPRDPPPPIAPLMVSLLAVNDQMCKWPIGDPGKEGFGFCGHRNFNGMPYCEFHAQIAYQRVGTRAARQVDKRDKLIEEWRQ